MKSGDKVLVSAISCLVIFLTNISGETDVTAYKNIRVRTVNPNGTGISVASRIHGGDYAFEGQFKYMVFLLAYASASHSHPDSTCSASLIHPSWVLTAAHCVSPAMIAVAGKANLLYYWINGRTRIPFKNEINETEFEVQERKILRAHVHPKYSSDTNEMDVALLLLDRPFDTSPVHRSPVSVLPLAKNEMPYAMKCEAIGWGLNDHQKQTFRLMYASALARTTAIGCHYLKRGPFICLEEGGAGICKGDSGSPLVCRDEAWGVASFSLSPVANSDCFSVTEEYYSQIYSQLDWIRDTMKNGALPATPPFSSPLIFIALYQIFMNISFRLPKMLNYDF